MNARYNAGRNGFGLKRINWETDTIQAVLISSLYQFSNAHRTLSSVSGKISEPADITGRTVDDEGFALALPVVFPKVLADLKAVGCVIFKRNAELIAFYDEIDGFPLVANGGDIDLAWPNNKLFRL